MVNDKGEYTKIRSDCGFFEYKLKGNAAATFGNILWPKDGWAPITPLRTMITVEQMEKSYGAEVAERYINKDDFTPVLFTRLIQSDADAISEQGLVEQWADTWHRATENHTGQHHRNKRVSVPTAAGEPVRG